MARPKVADGGDDLQIWRVSANIWNKQSLIADEEWPSSLGLSVKKNTLVMKYHKGPGT
jgi:hypothetical protein